MRRCKGMATKSQTTPSSDKKVPYMVSELDGFVYLAVCARDSKTTMIIPGHYWKSAREKRERDLSLIHI